MIQQNSVCTEMNTTVAINFILFSALFVPLLLAVVQFHPPPFSHSLNIQHINFGIIFNWGGNGIGLKR